METLAQVQWTTEDDQKQKQSTTLKWFATLLLTNILTLTLISSFQGEDIQKPEESTPIGYKEITITGSSFVSFQENSKNLVTITSKNKRVLFKKAILKQVLNQPDQEHSKYILEVPIKNLNKVYSSLNRPLLIFPYLSYQGHNNELAY